MKINTRHIYVSIVVAAVIAAVTHALSIGYGVTYASLSESESARRPMSMSVVYERTYGGHSDFVHLKIDTTYRQTGKGRFRLETVCDRKMSAPQFRRRIRRLFVRNAAMLRIRQRHRVERHGRNSPHNGLRMPSGHGHVRPPHVGGVVYPTAAPSRRRRACERQSGGTHTGGPRVGSDTRSG